MLRSFRFVIGFIILNFCTASYNPEKWNDLGNLSDKKQDSIDFMKDPEMSSSSLKQYRHRREQFPNAGAYKVPKNHILLDYGYNPRQLTSFASTNLLGQSQVAPNELIYPLGGNAAGGSGSDEDNVVAAGGHGHSQHGWGWGHGHKYKSEVNNSAVGMLGFLTLLALIQNVLRQMGGGFGLGGGIGGGGGAGGGAGTGGAGGVSVGRRNKRSSFHYADPTAEMVPHLLRLNQIRANSLPAICSSHPVCMLSKVVGKGLGETQRQLVKTTLKAVVSELLDSYGQPMKRTKLHKIIENAAMEGMKEGGDCHKTFKECKTPRQTYKYKKNLIM